MLESISPYALLCASKPKPAPATVHVYDLYSQSQQQSALQRPLSELSPKNLPKEPPETVLQPVRRTHYIADIQRRHNAANRR